MNSFTIESEEGYSIFNGISVLNKHIMSFYNFNFLAPNAVIALKRAADDKKPIYSQSITGISIDKDLKTIPLDDDNKEQLYTIYNAITFNINEISLDLAEAMLAKSAKSAIYLDYILKLYSLANSDDISTTARTSIISKIGLAKQLFIDNTTVCSLKDFNSYTGILAPSSVQYTYVPSLDYGTLQGIILYES